MEHSTFHSFARFRHGIHRIRITAQNAYSISTIPPEPPFAKEDLLLSPVNRGKYSASRAQCQIFFADRLSSCGADRRGCRCFLTVRETEPRRLPRGIATFWCQKVAPKPSACRFRGNNLRPALSGRSKNKTMQPPAPGTRAFGCSRSAPSENAAV